MKLQKHATERWGMIQFIVSTVHEYVYKKNIWDLHFFSVWSSKILSKKKCSQFQGKIISVMNIFTFRTWGCLPWESSNEHFPAKKNVNICDDYFLFYKWKMKNENINNYDEYFSSSNMNQFDENDFVLISIRGRCISVILCICVFRNFVYFLSYLRIVSIAFRCSFEEQARDRKKRKQT